MKTISLLILLPDKRSSRCRVDYETLPIGSNHLYQIKKVVRESDGAEFPVAAVEKINHVGHLDICIAEAAHGEYRKTLPKVKPETKPQPPKDGKGQTFMKLDTQPGKPTIFKKR